MNIKTQYTDESKIHIIQEYIRTNMKQEDFSSELACELSDMVNLTCSEYIQSMYVAFGLVLLIQFKEDINKVVKIINAGIVADILFQKLLSKGEIDKIVEGAKTIYVNLDPKTGKATPVTIH